MEKMEKKKTEKKLYEPKSVLVTGAAGFIGSNTVVYLAKRYTTIKWICLDKLTYCGSLSNLAELKDCPNFKFVKGDIVSVDLVNFLMASEAIDTVLHFAAETHVDNSFGNSLQFTQTNVFGTHVLLESAKLFGAQIKRFIHVSTDEVYGESKADALKLDAQAPLNPTNPYAATKVAAEYLVRSYRHSFGLPTIITRGNNVYGPKQYPEKLIPKFINLLQQGKPCPIHGSGDHRRNFLFVDDVARAFETVLFRGEVGAIYNIGNDFEISNRDVAARLIALFGLTKQKEKYEVFVKDRAFNDFRYHIDPASLEALGWKPIVDFETGLKLTKDWYIEHPDHWPNVSSALAAHPVFV